ncbi:MAG: dnaX [Candidatus Brocadiaceae bacterium]|nr:dnaX [Candidatus Brocadiaceae bacterium]
MSYVVLARRYRPQTFEDIVGQVPIVTTLRNAIRTNRVAHAYLLAGPRGVGKTSMARILSKALNCQHGPTETPCNVCDICRHISDGTDIDVLEIDGASNRGIDEVRNIRQNVGYAASRSRYKIYIIDEVHMLTREAFNALLKTLEEPPPHVKFLFATTSASRLPETVQSRCQRFDFKNISLLDIEKRLSDICNTEGVQIEPSVLHAIARYARGGLRDSQSVLDQLIAFCRTKITLEDVNFVLGCIEEDKILGLFEAFLQDDAASALKIVNDVLSEGKTCGEFVDQLLAGVRDLLVFSSCGKDVEWATLNASLVQRYGKAFSCDTLLYMIQILSDTRARTTDFLLQRILLETAIIKLCRMESIGSLGEIVEGIAALENKLAAMDNGSTLRIRETPPPPQKTKEAVPSQICEPPVEMIKTPEIAAKNEKQTTIDGSAWDKILLIVKNKKKSTWSLLREGRFSGFKDGEITVEFPANCAFHRERLNQPEEKKIVEESVGEVAQGNVRCKFALSRNGEARKAEETPDAVSSAPQTVNAGASEPAVKRTLEMFNGHIVRVNK